MGDVDESDDVVSDGVVSVEVLVEVDVDGEALVLVEVFSVDVEEVSVDVDGISVEVTVLALVDSAPFTTPLGGNAQLIPVINSNK